MIRPSVTATDVTGRNATISIAATGSLFHFEESDFSGRLPLVRTEKSATSL